MTITTSASEYSAEMIRAALRKAVRDLYDAESDIHSFTPETLQTEWNLTAHLAPMIARYFESYSYDVDVMKPNIKRKRPDVIIHKRGSSDRNLLVVEIKRNRSASAVKSDARKIREFWFSERLRYQFGAVINLKGASADEADVCVLVNSG